MKRRCSSRVCRSGRKASVSNERRYTSAAIASASSGVGPSDHPRTLRSMPREQDEPVRLTRIYTRGGDTGETSLGDGSRASKLDPRIRAYGDRRRAELAHRRRARRRPAAGAARAARARPERAVRRRRRPLRAVRRPGRPPAHDAGDDRRPRGALRRAQRRRSPELKSFVLPGGTEAAARLHVARTVARRAELAALAGGRQPARPRLPEPRLRPALHPRARGERARGPGRAALAARRLAHERLDGVRNLRGRRGARQQRAHADAAGSTRPCAGVVVSPTICTSGRSAWSSASV